METLAAQNIPLCLESVIWFVIALEFCKAFKQATKLTVGGGCKHLLPRPGGSTVKLISVFLFFGVGLTPARLYENILPPTHVPSCICLERQGLTSWLMSAGFRLVHPVCEVLPTALSGKSAIRCHPRSWHFSEF